MHARHGWVGASAEIAIVVPFCIHAAGIVGCLEEKQQFLMYLIFKMYI